MKILLTGEPRSGKTTLLEEFVEDLSNKQGFLAREIKQNKNRIGFELVSSEGQVATLASVESESEIRVSKYGVNLGEIDKFIGQLPPIAENSVLYIDEIGQMELYSNSFKLLVATYLSASNFFVGTITSVYENDFVKQVLRNEDVILLVISPENRGLIRSTLAGFAKNISALAILSKAQKIVLADLAKSYAAQGQYIQLKKLFNNALLYVTSGKVKEHPEQHFVVHGNTGDHKV